MEEETKNIETQEQQKTPPSREEVIDWYTKQNEVLQLRCLNAEYEARIQVAHLRRMRALIEMGSMLQEPPKEQEPNTTGQKPE